MAPSVPTISAAMPAYESDDDKLQVSLVDIAIQHLLETTDSQWVSFVNQERRATLESRTFSRFIIGDGPWTFGQWGFGDDINLYFLTMDNENRWAEVLTEAMGIEVGSKDLKEATKDGVFDLTDERLCHFRDGRRTQYWFLKNANPPKCRVTLTYCRISSDWLGSANITTALKKCTLPDWPENEPNKSYTTSYKKLIRLQKVSQGPSFACMQKIYPLARTWARLNDLWTLGTIDAHTLFHIVSSLWLTGRKFDPASEAETMLITLLEVMASEDESPTHIPEHCRSALAAAAEETLKDPEIALLAVRTAKSSLAASQPQEQPPPPKQQKQIRRTSFKLGVKFRDAKGTISRLRFDVKHSGIEYDIGYLDRFEGMRWMSLERWGNKETEDEDFIPEHRVRQIVRVIDGTIVWDREKRIDKTGEV